MKKLQFFFESMGWKMQKCDQTAVDTFCNEIGVAKGTLMLWMHNQKNSFGSKKENSKNRSKHKEINMLINHLKQLTKEHSPNLENQPYVHTQ